MKLEDKTEEKKVKLDSELEMLWKDGLSQEKAGIYMHAVEEAGVVKADFALRAKILDYAKPISRRTAVARLVPILVPALLLMWMVFAPDRKQLIVPTEGVSVASNENEYIEIAALMDQFTADDSIVEEIESSTWIFLE